ncbi:MAG: HAMP domain-containing histidine kinase [Planctomycetales bacterium]|nr:HAMP domain-containing histidine kinase [Planctomycetales bacterium]
MSVCAGDDYTASRPTATLQEEAIFDMEVQGVHLHWPIQTKLKIGLALSLVTVLALLSVAHFGLYSYRGLVRGLSARSAELPLASEIRQHVSDLRVTLSQASEYVELPYESAADLISDPAADDGAEFSAIEASSRDMLSFRNEYGRQLGMLRDALNRYREKLQSNHAEGAGFSDDGNERKTLAAIEKIVEGLGDQSKSNDDQCKWLLGNIQLGELRERVELLHQLVAELPSYLHQRFQFLASDVRSRYRTAIVLAWAAGIAALALLGVAIQLSNAWFARPLKVLWRGSQEVAAGNLDHRIRLTSQDEMGQLANAINAMTDRFCEIRADLDRQVRERTKQVVRSEQLASVGFLAAGVSHEINNPLASISLCSESLESRLHDLLDLVDQEHSEDVQVARNYLQMIQREAFRCKQITEKLLDFARRGDAQRHAVELRELVAGVIEMVRHLGRYNNRGLELVEGPPVVAEVNAQEIKQVVLNLITNGLESLGDQGEVRIELRRLGDTAEIKVVDNGCGMSDDVQKHLFEPFYTNRRTGQGIGLGLSITHRIVEEHHGTIEATSEGAGRGSQFVVRLPATTNAKEESHRYQAA